MQYSQGAREKRENLRKIILGFILSSLMEKNLLRTLKINNNNIGGFFNSPLSWLMIFLTVLSVAGPFVVDYVKKKNNIEFVGGDE